MSKKQQRVVLVSGVTTLKLFGDSKDEHLPALLADGWQIIHTIPATTRDTQGAYFVLEKKD